MEQKSTESFQTKHITIPLSVAVHTKLKLRAIQDQITLGDLTKKALLQYINNDAPRRQRGKQ